MKWIGVALIAGSFLLPPVFAGDFYINLASQILIAALFGWKDVCLLVRAQVKSFRENFEVYAARAPWATRSASRTTARGDLVIGLVVFMPHYTPDHYRDSTEQGSDKTYAARGNSSYAWTGMRSRGWARCSLSRRSPTS